MRQLIGGDRELYQELLGNERLKRLHLAPLIGHPNLPDWADKARLALDMGYSAEQIVDAAFGDMWSWSGNLSDMWNEWLMRFDELQPHPDERIRQIGELGRGVAAERAERALKEERAERIRGF